MPSAVRDISLHSVLRLPPVQAISTLAALVITEAEWEPAASGERLLSRHQVSTKTRISVLKRRSISAQRFLNRSFQTIMGKQAGRFYEFAPGESLTHRTACGRAASNVQPRVGPQKPELIETSRPIHWQAQEPLFGSA